MNERAKKSLDIASMEADGNVLTVTTNSLNTAFKNELSEPVASIIDVNSGAAEDEPVGTGPYKIDSVAGNGDVELSAYDSYWQGEPKIKTVHAKYLTDDQSKVSALQSGEVCALMNVADDQLGNLSDTSKYTLHQTNQARAHMLYFNMKSEAMQDDAVRQAVGMCVDRDSYVSSIYNNSAEASHAAFPDSSGYADGVTCDGSDGTSNYGHYSNAKVDELLGQLKKTGDEAEQKELVKQIQQIALDDHAYVYMVHTLVNDVTAADVENLAMQGQYDWLNYQMSYK